MSADTKSAYSLGDVAKQQQRREDTKGLEGLAAREQAKLESPEEPETRYERAERLRLEMEERRTLALEKDIDLRKAQLKPDKAIWLDTCIAVANTLVVKRLGSCSLNSEQEVEEQVQLCYDIGAIAAHQAVYQRSVADMLFDKGEDD
jgi:hypothetical protein